MQENNNNNLINQINQRLPQTQCGLCTYAGCKPYAQAIVEQGETIDKCLPGGLAVMAELGQLTQQDPQPYVTEMQAKQRPPAVAEIREDECIGCTKCIQACPVDAIIGAGKQMHTVVTADCTGCELCVEPCPVDCIDIRSLPYAQYDKVQAQHRYERKQDRDKVIKEEKMARYQRQVTLKQAQNGNKTSSELVAKRNAIAEAVARVKEKQQQKKRNWPDERG